MRPRNSTLWGHALVAALTMTAFGSPAFAADPEAAAAAQALYDQAVTAMDKRAWEDACPKLEEAVRLVPEGIGAKLTLAECYEGLGKLAAAWVTYNLAEAQAARAGQADRQKLAADRRAALEPRLPRLRIDVSDTVKAIPGLVIERDGTVVGLAQMGLALPIDQGEHRVVAKAPGRKTWEGVVSVSVLGATVVARVPELAMDEATPLPGPAAAPPAAHAEPGADEAGGGGGDLRLGGYFSVGLGAVGLVVGGIFGASAMSKKSDAEDGHCTNGNHCDQEGVDLLNDSISAGNLSTIFVIAGAAFVGTGVVLIATAPADQPNVALQINPSGAALTGRFQ